MGKSNQYWSATSRYDLYGKCDLFPTFTIHGESVREKRIVDMFPLISSARFRYFYLRFCREIFPAFLLDCYMRFVGRKPM